jgi:hypothetical protein
MHVEPSMLKDPGPGIPTCQMRDACRVALVTSRAKPQGAPSSSSTRFSRLHVGFARRPQMLPDVVAAQLKTTCISAHASVRADVQARTENGRLGADRRPV